MRHQAKVQACLLAVLVLVTAGSIVGPQMQRRLAAGGYEDPPDTVIVPTVTVDSGGADCDTAARSTADAAKLYG
jgi:hypothetical protein